MRSKRMIQTVVACAAMTAGCNLLTPLIFVGEHKKKVSPEFDKLQNSRVAVLVWIDQVVLFDYPYARFELCTYISDKLAAEMNPVMSRMSAGRSWRMTQPCWTGSGRERGP